MIQDSAIITKLDEFQNIISESDSTNTPLDLFIQECLKTIPAKSLDEILSHGISLAKIVTAEIGLGKTSATAALLHGFSEKFEPDPEMVGKFFGPEVKTILVGIRKLSGFQLDKLSIQSDNFRKLLLSVVDDIRVILIKMAHNLLDIRQFEQLPENQQQMSLNEAKFLYVPITHRLGLYKIKNELEDQWMRRMFPEIYFSIDQKIKATRDRQSEYLDRFIAPLKKVLEENRITATIKGRVKSIPSIWLKMQKQKVDFEDVFDLYAIRIILSGDITREKADCWNVYSLVSDTYVPDPSRLRDWISTPKASGYESLHTTVKGPDNQWVEVQIRTQRMDDIAEKGLAAHWKYKENRNQETSDNWLHSVREKVETMDSSSIDETIFLKQEKSFNNIFVFTPAGELRQIKSGSTVLDFAFDIHSNLGTKCTGAKINNRIYPLKHKLSNGDKVEIISSKNQYPKAEWLDFVVTSKAANKIKRILKEKNLAEVDNGREILQRKFKHWKVLFNDENVDKLIRKFGFKNALELYSGIATEKIDIQDIKQVFEEKEVQEIVKEPETTSTAADLEKEDLSKLEEIVVIEDGISNLDYKFARCCSPVAGDSVFGFVTIKTGITIHRTSCPNANYMMTHFGHRIIRAKWKEKEGTFMYKARILIAGNDSLGITHEITQVISKEYKISLVSIHFDKKEENRFEGQVIVQVSGINQLKGLIKKLASVKGLTKVVRDDY